VIGSHSGFDQFDGGDFSAPPSHPPLLASPNPPSFASSSSVPPPAPPDENEGGAAKAILKVGSVLVILIICLGFLLFAYCFYFGEIQGALHSWSGGRFGKPKFSLLPKSLQEVSAAEREELPRKKRGGKKRLHLTNNGIADAELTSVTCVTPQMTQKKDIDMAGCTTLDELLLTIREVFAHLLGDVAKKELTLLCWVNDNSARSTGAWKTVGAASDIDAVCRSATAFKLLAKGTVAEAAKAIAFPKALAGAKVDASALQQEASPLPSACEQTHGSTREPSRKCKNSQRAAPPPPAGSRARGDASSQSMRSNKAADDSERASMGYDPKMMDAFAEFMRTQGAAAEKLQPPISDEEEDTEDSDQGPRPNSACAIDGQHWSDGEDADRLSAVMDDHANVRVAPQRHVRRQAFVEEDRLDGEPLMPMDVAGPPPPVLMESVPASDPAAGADDMDDYSLARAEKHRATLVGKRVRICNLQSKMDLNGRVGAVAAYDKGKDRFRVRIDAQSIDGFATVLAFRAINLTVI